jgi:putative DNA primase/helicase
MTNPMDILDAASSYGRAGYRVHPCDPETKKPLTLWKEAASSDPRTIRDLWLRHASGSELPLIGVCTGNGLVVVDDDRGNAEPEDDMAKTLTCKTRSRGWHHWFRCSNTTIGNRVGIIPGVDIRGAGGYVIAPPSPGWSWWNQGTDIQELPGWVVTLMTARAQRGRQWGSGFAPSRTPVGEGQRNDYIARFAGYAIRYGDVDSLEALREECLIENSRICVPPLSSQEVMTTAASIWRIDSGRS